MRWLDQIRMRVLLLFRRNHAATRLDDELQFHLYREIAENISNGMSHDEARCAALRTFGNPALLRDETHAAWSWNWLESLVRDLKYGFRTIRRTPGFAAISILVIALGIGANVALFTIVRSILLKPLPYADPSRLVRLYEQSANGKMPYNNDSGAVFAEWQKLNHGFDGMAIAGFVDYNLSGEGGQLPESIHGAEFSWNMLPVLGVRPALGRNFTADDDKPSANPTVLLSWGLWKRRFGGDQSILNRTILLDDRAYTVIGILPSWFALPEPEIQLWTPVYFSEPPEHMTGFSHDFQAVGRLEPGATQEQAVAELSLITRRIHDQHADKPWVSYGANSRPLLDAIVGNMKKPLLMLLGATACVLLIACLNVANLLVARATTRRKELAIRTALGGSRLRLLRQHLMESLLLAVTGGIIGFALAAGALHWFAEARHDLARSDSIAIDGVVLLFALGLVFLCAAFAGLISAYSLRNDAPTASLQESSRSQSAGVGRTRLRAALLSLEVGLTVVLLIGAGLLLKSYAALRSSDMGCVTENLLKMDLNLPQVRYRNPSQVENFFSVLLARVRGLHGVDAAGLIFPAVPGEGYGGDNSFTIVEHPPLPAGSLQFAIHRWADPGYFSAMEIPILRGHTFEGSQPPGHESQVIVSDSFVRQFFPGENPIGKHLNTAGTRPLEIIGVVGDTRIGPGDPKLPMMYFPFFGFPFKPGDEIDGSSLVVRSDRDVTQFSLPIQQIVSQMDRDLPVSDVLTMDQIMGQRTLEASFEAALLMGFAASSLVLAAVGLFGVLSYIVSQRTTEIGIRIALGAARGRVLRLMLADGLRPAVLGLVLGLAASAGTARLIESMLFGTHSLDPAVFIAVAAVLLLVALLACMTPAWRASRLDPMQALRSE